jgi:TrpR-related protein YerC/YecD
MEVKELKKISINIQKAFLSLTSEKECFSFLRDLMTETEIIEFSQRLDIAMRLKNAESYTQIEKSTGVSSTTIARVGKYLNGKYGGYKLVLEKIT